MSKPSLARFTVALIKPDAYNKRLDIMEGLLESEWVVLAAKDMTFTRAMAERFYHCHNGKPYFDRLIDHMTSGRLLALKLNDATPDVHKSWRTFMGPTDPKEAQACEEYTLRGDYGTDLPRNAFHGSDSQAEAILEAAIIGF